MTVIQNVGSVAGQLRKRLGYRYREVVVESGIDPGVAAERGYYLEKTKKGLERIGFTRKQQLTPAMVIPRFSPSGEEIKPQIKPDAPRLEEGRTGVREVKYECPPKAEPRLSVHPRAVKYMRNWHPLWITEGDKKGDALVSRKALAVVLQGVACWDVPEDWEDIRLHGREAIVAFDADAMVNPAVQRELGKLCDFLRGRGARVKYLRWPEHYRGTKTGVDDYLAGGHGTVEDLHKLADEAPDEDAIPVGRWMSEIEPERVEWFWERRIPLGKVTMLDGDPGLGKSTILYDLAARVTAGKDLPDGQPLEKGGALVVSMEDGAADTIVPRFLAAGGDPKRAKIIGSEHPLVIPDDVDRLERAVRQAGARFVAIDPVMSFLADNVNTNSDQQVRRALQPLVDMAQSTGAAVVLCRHLNKSGGGVTIYRGQGSIGFIGIARSGLMVGEYPDREGEFILAGAKGNLSEKPDSLAYRIAGAATADGIPAARIEYLGRTEVSADQMNAPPQHEGERGALAEAKEFLSGVLRDGPVWSRQVYEEAKEAGVSVRSLQRAKAELNVKSCRDGDSRKWMWVLPGPPEDGGETRRSSPRHSDPGDVDELGDLRSSSSTSPSVANLADSINPSAAGTTKQAYISEHRQHRQHRQRSRATDDLTARPTWPSTTANAATLGGHERRLTPEEAERVKVLMAQGMAPGCARAEVLGLDGSDDAR